VNTWNNVYNGVRPGLPSYYNPSNRIDGDWQLTRIRYLGGTADSPGAFAPGVSLTNGGGVPNTYFNAGAGAWAYDTYNDTFALKRRDLSKNIVDSRALVWQGYWLDGKIVGTAGWRRDKNKDARKSSTSVSSTTGYVTVDDTLNPASVVEGDTTTYGVVVHPVSWLSLHYNQSENFVAAAANVNVFGETIGPPSGAGEDYGFSLNLLDGRLNVRMNWYEIAQKDSRITNEGPDILAQWELPWFDQVVIPGLAAQYGLTHTEFFSPVTWGDNRIEETADVVSEGVEVEIIANPTRNWRIMANISQQKASKANIGGALERWVEEVLPSWQSAVWWDGPETYDAGWGVDGNLETYFNTFNTGRVLPTFKSEEGKLSPQLREWRVNLISSYDITEGNLAGVNFGGAIRWEDDAAIGFPAITDIVAGTETLVGLDIDNPYTDNGEFHFDVWAGYTKRIWNDKVKWNLQLNVRDLTQSKGFKPINADSDGRNSIYRIEFGPTWSLTSTFNW
jgi:hypothetical protein